MRIPLASSGLRQKDIDQINIVLNSGKLTMGEEVKKFENQMAKYLGVNHFVMMNSGSSANLAMLEALVRPTKSSPRLLPGDGVLVPAIAWPTTIWPLIQLGLHPIFVDVEFDSVAMDLVKAQETIDSHEGLVKAIFPIHPLGYTISHLDLLTFSEKNNLILINDVCESLGSRMEKVHAGTSGYGGSFSFYFSHHITTMEGGGVATNSDEYADDLRSIRSHGWSRDRQDVATWRGEVSNNDAKFLFVSTGFNIRPMEIQAAIGISQLEDVETFIEKRRSIADRVFGGIKNSGLSLHGNKYLNPTLRESHSWMLLPIHIMYSGESRREGFLRTLERMQVETRPVLTGNFLSQPAIRRINIGNQNPNDFPTANKITKESFMVGAHHDLSDEQVDYLVESLIQADKEN
jgi:CDP-6-deoxy-D-xylo-4-hexulose-3-dehydrase